MNLVARSSGYVEVSLSLDELVTISYALGRARRCRELQSVDVLIGFSSEDLQELQNRFRSLWGRDPATAELSFRSAHAEAHREDIRHSIFVQAMESTPESVILRLSDTTVLAVANALMISRGEIGFSEAETILNSTDEALAHLVFDFRSIATFPKREATANHRR